MKREKRGLNPVWLVFVAPGLARGWLLFHTTPGSAGTVSWLALAINASLLLALLVLTWHFAADLADAAGLWQRAKERFLVMATLCALAPPLSIAVVQTSHRGSFTAVEVLFLWLLKLSFRLLARRPARMVRHGRWSAWVLCCLLCAAGFWLLGSAFALSWPLASHSWLTLIFPEWPMTPLSLAQLWAVVVCSCAMLLAIGSAFLSFCWQHPLFLQLRKLVGVSLLFCGALVALGALVGITHVALDSYIYFLLAFALIIPVCNAAFFALPYMITKPYPERLVQQGQEHHSSDPPVEREVRHGARKIILHAMFLAILGLYFWSQLCTYMFTGSTPP
jgi:hypothetical protein